MAAMPTDLFRIPSAYSFRCPLPHKAQQPNISHLNSPASSPSSFNVPYHIKRVIVTRLLIRCWVTLALHNSWWCWLHWCMQSGSGDCSLCFVSLPFHFISFPTTQFLTLRLPSGQLICDQSSTAYHPCFVKRGQPTIYQFYRRSKQVVPIYILQMLRSRISPAYVGYSWKWTCHSIYLRVAVSPFSQNRGLLLHFHIGLPGFPSSQQW
jgi:hypothetical protein